MDSKHLTGLKAHTQGPSSVLSASGLPLSLFMCWPHSLLCMLCTVFILHCQAVTCAGEFMLARYKEVVDAVLNFRDAWNDSKDHLLRRAALGLMPRLAAFAPERFASSYLNTCTQFLLAALRCIRAVPC